MQKKSVLTKIVYALSALGLVMIASGWILFSYYFEDALNRYAKPRLTEAARIATHGRYSLAFGRIQYAEGSCFCKDFILARSGYDSSEHGNTVKKISIDSVRFIGISWWDALWGNDMHMTSLEMSSPKIYFTDVDEQRKSQPDLPIDTFAQASVTGKKIPVISFDSIILRDIAIFLPERSHAGDKPSFRDIELKMTNFRLDSKSLKAQPLLYSERVDFALARASYPLDDSDYSMEFRNIRGSFSDSSLSIDTFAYKPLFSRQAFADRHRYVQPRLDFRSSHITVHAINFVKLIGGAGLNFRSCAAASWSLDFFSDRRVRDDPHPPNAVLPNDIVRSIKIPVTIDSIIFDHGHILWSERWPGMEPGTLSFSDARIAAYPFCTDSLHPNFSAKTKIAVTALFMDQSKVNGLAIYALHDKPVNFDINATVGPFDAKKLNTELIPVERLEVTEGSLSRGSIRMNVVNGVATTTVMPEYQNLSIKVLAKGANESRGIMEWIKTFAANTFALRSSNVAGNKPVSGISSLRRTKDQEFLQFAWLALRKSLGKVVGFK